MATEDYKGQFKAIAKDLGISVKQIRAMPDDDLDMLIENRRILREQSQTVREMGGMNRGGKVTKKAIGATDYRMNKGGLLLSSTDNRKKK